jgi:hypothetical protein
MGVEVTSVRDYLPKNDEVDNLLARDEQTRICAYMYLKDGKTKMQILNEKKLDNNFVYSNMYLVTDLK